MQNKLKVKKNKKKTTLYFYIMMLVIGQGAQHKLA